MESTITRIARAATLDGFTTEASAANGVCLRELEPMTTLVVRTQNTTYRIVVADEGGVMVEGGRFFPELTTAYLEGASFGGSLLKVGWIAVGLRMELRTQGQRIVTSPVREIATERHAANWIH
jgi:hypothetical protein